MSHHDSAQMFLFSDDPVRCFETFAGVDEEFLQLLERFDLISFDYRHPGVTEDMLLEVIFLRTVLRSGYPFAKVIRMLDQLRKPYRYDLARIFWDISVDRWRHVDEFNLPTGGDSAARGTPEDEIVDQLRDLASLGDREALLKVQGELRSLLEQEGSLFD